MTPQQAAVEQCDREAAAEQYERDGRYLFASIVKSGGGDDDTLVRSFARHRIAALSRPTAVGEAVLAERERCARVLDKLEPPRRRWINRADAIAAIRTPPAPQGDAE